MRHALDGRRVAGAARLRVRSGAVVFCVSLVLAFGPSAGAETRGALWVNRYDGPGEGHDFATAVVVSPDGSRVFVTGASAGTKSGADYATLGYDTVTGSLLWTSRYNGPGNGDDQAKSLVVSPDGSKVFVTGWSVGSGTGDDYTTVAYDAATGHELWIRRYNGAGNSTDQAFAVSVSPDGSKVFVTGGSQDASTVSAATFAYDATTGHSVWVSRFHAGSNGRATAYAITMSSDGSKVFVVGQAARGTMAPDYATVAYDAATGSQRWARLYNGTGNANDRALAVTPSPDGSKVLVTGFSPGQGSGYDYATLAYDTTTGEAVWVRRYNGPGNGSDQAVSLAMSPDGSKVFVTGTGVRVGTGQAYATLAYDVSTGQRLWVRRYQGPGNGADIAASVAVSPDGSKVFVTGASAGVWPTPPGYYDYATVAYDATGATLWVRRYNGPGNSHDVATSVAVSPDGSRVFVTGHSWGYGAPGNYDYATVAYPA